MTLEEGPGMAYEKNRRGKFHHPYTDPADHIQPLIYWPLPAVMEHEKAPGRPQALLKKDQNLIKNGAVGYRPRFFVCLCVCHAF